MIWFLLIGCLHKLPDGYSESSLDTGALDSTPVYN